MHEKQELIDHIHKIHTTILGVMRIKRNLNIEVDDVVAWSKQKLLQKDVQFHRNGKNWYVVVEDMIFTINAFSYTIITAHKQK